MPRQTHVLLSLFHLHTQELLILQVRAFLAFAAITLHSVAIDQIVDHSIVLRDLLLVNLLHETIQAHQCLPLDVLLGQRWKHLRVFHLKVLRRDHILIDLCGRRSLRCQQRRRHQVLHVELGTVVPITFSSVLIP